jgi:hypothetical protein
MPTYVVLALIVQNVIILKDHVFPLHKSLLEYLSSYFIEYMFCEIEHCHIGITVNKSRSYLISFLACLGCFFSDYLYILENLNILFSIVGGSRCFLKIDIYGLVYLSRFSVWARVIVSLQIHPGLSRVSTLRGVRVTQGVLACSGVSPVTIERA